jgi:hypothetical protein
MLNHGRKFIFSLFVGFCSSQQGVAAVNGHPDEDPVVKGLRATFAESVAPSAEEVVGKWKCQIFSAIRNNIAVRKYEHEITHLVNNVFKSEWAEPRVRTYLRLMNDGLTRDTIWEGGVEIYKYRISKLTGELISESSTSKSIDAPDSITQPGFKVDQYGRCSKQVSE